MFRIGSGGAPNGGTNGLCPVLLAIGGFQAGKVGPANADVDPFAVSERLGWVRADSSLPSQRARFEIERDHPAVSDGHI